jgi:hypothetical protein
VIPLTTRLAGVDVMPDPIGFARVGTPIQQTLQFFDRAMTER